jgi:hypothetical protein
MNELSTDLLQEIAYALAARARNLNDRYPEPTGDSITNTRAAYEMAVMILNARELGTDV